MYSTPRDEVGSGDLPGAPTPFPWAGSALSDALDDAILLSNEMAMLAAERFRSIQRLHAEMLSHVGPGGRSTRDVMERSLRLEVASALRITEYAAEELLYVAVTLVEEYPAALISLAHGRITEQHAKIMVKLLSEAPEEVRRPLVGRAVDLAEDLPVGSFRRALKKLIEAACADSAAERHAAALEGRRVDLVPQRDGMATLEIHGPEVELRAIHGRVTAMARAIGEAEDETRTLDQLRADVACDLLVDGSTTVHPEQVRGIRATVVVTVPVLSLLDDDAAGDPPMVEGVGPIPIDKARELCGGAREWMRVLTHPETGMVLSVGRTQYRPPAALRRLVKWRSDRCMAPGCGVPASRCEIDHNVAWIDGGCTSLENHAPFCTGHHTVKHHGGWRVTQIPDSGGAIEWISPAGRRYVVEPERRVPVFTQSPEPAPF